TERGEVGWEPGIDVRHTEVELGENSLVTIVDYNEDRYRVVSKIDKHSIQEYLNDEQPWASTRWINVNGLSWEVVRAIAAFYNLHPLAVEDMVDIPKRAKADHYKNQTFCTLPLHKLVDTSKIDSYFDSLNKYSLFSRLIGRKKRKETLQFMNLNLTKIMAEQKMMTMQEWNNPRIGQDSISPKRSLEDYHEVVAVEQVSIFLIENHTVISFFEASAEDVEGPILSRIASNSTLLREYPEPSLLLQAILDGIVDIALKIISEYQRYISELQTSILTNPKVSHTRDLHILSEELSMLRSTLMPIYTLVQNLRDHASLKHEIGTTERVLAGGQISEFSKLYLADVADHVVSFTDNLDLMRHTTENMINLIFNTMSVQENEAMRQLTLVTIVFLPLTFLTGYFGMNFRTFGALDHNTMYFWSIAIPVTVLVCGLLSWQWIRTQMARVGRYLDRRELRRKHSRQQYLFDELMKERRRNADAKPTTTKTWGDSTNETERDSNNSSTERTMADSLHVNFAPVKVTEVQVPSAPPDLATAAANTALQQPEPYTPASTLLLPIESASTAPGMRDIYGYYNTSGPPQRRSSSPYDRSRMTALQPPREYNLVRAINLEKLEDASRRPQSP
ncbi:hypothetical protein V1512DRAFT_209473, partial [Lipomyces arxii]|uniref:uncharacterized protein n=1 Tax=Lipomyces arxii TaxID=56418 RepID=UPI0034CDF326